MAALLVGLAIMGLMASIALPVWSQAAQREKEAELVFRGEQYARAVGLFQRKMGPGTLPPNLDLLVDQKFLRRKYLDPITGEDFRPVNAAEAQAAGLGLGTTPGGTGLPAGGQLPAGAGLGGVQGGFPGGGGTQLGRQGTGSGQGAGAQGAETRPGGPGTPGAPGQGGLPPGGIMGVVSASTKPSLKLYNGRDHYNQWAFVYNPPAPPAGGAAGGVQGGAAGGVGPGGVKAQPGAPGAGPRPPVMQPGAPQRPLGVPAGGPQGSGGGPNPMGRPPGQGGGMGSPLPPGRR